jgi:hypothetical protein
VTSACSSRSRFFVKTVGNHANPKVLRPESRPTGALDAPAVTFVTADTSYLKSSRVGTRFLASA